MFALSDEDQNLSKTKNWRNAPKSREVVIILVNMMLYMKNDRKTKNKDPYLQVPRPRNNFSISYI